MIRFLYIRIMITEAGGNAADYYGNYANIVDQIGPISHIPLSLDMVEKLEANKLSPDVVSVLYSILDCSRFITFCNELQLFHRNYRLLILR